ncbi:MAG: hypothetical protein ACI87W_001379 [Halieaceae bacterium]|jgi:hypothetical protein
MQRTEARIDCPYCGEALTVLLEDNDAGVEYTEDCQVCCQPMVLAVWLEGGTELAVSARREDD